MNEGLVNMFISVHSTTHFGVFFSGDAIEIKETMVLLIKLLTILRIVPAIKCTIETFIDNHKFTKIILVQFPAVRFTEFIDFGMNSKCDKLTLISFECTSFRKNIFIINTIQDQLL